MVFHSYKLFFGMETSSFFGILNDNCLRITVLLVSALLWVSVLLNYAGVVGGVGCI